MKMVSHGSRSAAVAALLFFAGGCLISGTFTVVEEFDLTADNGIYFYAVDVTDEEDWRDHKDDIDKVDLVGFELWLTNHEAAPVTFSIYVDDFSQPQWGTVEEVEANCIRVFGDLTIATGPSVQTHVTYGQSLAYIRNIAELRRLGRQGQFHYYGIVEGGSSSDGFTIDTARVVVTFTASR